MTQINRREALASLATASSLALISASGGFADEGTSAKNKPVSQSQGFKPNYILASPMYGYAPLAEIVPEVAKTGATHLDIWPKSHGNQREQLDKMGEEAFAALLKKSSVKLGCITQYKLGPFGLQEEMRLAKRLGCKLIVCGGRGPKGLKGADLKRAVKNFIEQLKPHLAVAEETGVTIAVENHGSNLIESPDSLKWLADLRPCKNLAIAFAPYHLPQDEEQLAGLIKTLGNRIAMFYAWQHGMGCHKKLPKEQELLQMPGRGELDFAPLLAALDAAKYTGWTEIFMHPVPRGIPILDTNKAVTDEINRARDYLTKCAKRG
jgi:sugar phosphate isomerase/epimerase